MYESVPCISLHLMMTIVCALHIVASHDDDCDGDDDGRGRDVAQVCGHRLPKTDGNDDNADDDFCDNDVDDGGATKQIGFFPHILMIL